MEVKVDAAHGQDLAALGEILSHVFRFPAERADDYFDRVGHSNIRVARVRSGEVAGGLCILPMGQWFGGRSVSMAGIAAVGVAPQHRAAGVASALMRETVRSLHQSGFAISTLYPATQPVYRRVGYEHAGMRWKILMSPSMIDVRDRELSLRPSRDSDETAIHDLWRLAARSANGLLDRSDFIWARTLEGGRTLSGQSSARRYVVESDGGAIEGYVSVVQADAKTRAYDLSLTDFLARTPAAARRILTLIADHRSMSDVVSWSGAPSDPALGLLAEQRFEITQTDVWMTRIVDVERALTERGYAPAVDATIELDMHGDDVLPEHNNGRFIVTVKDGRAIVKRGESDRRGATGMRIHINGFASLFTGHLSADSLRSAGRAECDDSIATLATSIFAGPAPWMSDRF